MQGKGLITIIAVALGLICITELLPTWYVNKIESEAKALAGNNEEKYQKELDKLSKDTLNLGFTKLYYTNAKEREMKLGLDLKGGINVLLEINQRDLVNNLTNYSANPILIPPTISHAKFILLSSLSPKYNCTLLPFSGIQYNVFPVTGNQANGQILPDWSISHFIYISSSLTSTTSPVIEASDEDIALSTGIIFILNTVALFLFAFFINYFKLNAEQTGIWTALSIHDTSSVVSAAAFHSTEALKIATIMKLTRTLWIIPIVIVLSFLNKSENKKIKFPIFILFFILASIVATIINLPAIYSLLTQVGKMMLSLALYMIGTSLNIQAIKKMTGKNLLYGITLWIFSIISGYMIMMFL